MVRISGVDIPNEKRVEIALTYIYGIGPTRAREILAGTAISPDTRSRARVSAAAAHETRSLSNKLIGSLSCPKAARNREADLERFRNQPRRPSIRRPRLTIVHGV